MTQRRPRFDGPFFSHPCNAAGCRAEGCFGEGVRLLHGRLGVWFCGQHWRDRRMEVAANRSPSVIQSGAAPPEGGQQFKLL